MNVMLCATPRVGSWYLHTLLGSTGAVGELPMRELNPKDNYKDCLQPGANGVTSVKVMAYHIERVPFEAMINSKHIWLRRRDKVRQAISWLKALASNVWYSEDPKAVTIDIDFENIMVYINHIEKFESVWLSFFQEHELDYRVCWYENVVANPEQTVADVLDYLELSPEIWPPKSSHQKLLDEYSEKVYQAYRKAQEVYNEALRD